MERLKYFVGGQFKESETSTYYDLYNPSTGEVVAQAPNCTKKEVEEAIKAANEAYKKWSQVPVMKRVQYMYKVRDLLIKHEEELTHLVAEKHGKVWDEIGRASCRERV